MTGNQHTALSPISDAQIGLVVKNCVSYIILLSIFLTGNGLEFPGFTIYWYYPLYVLFIAYGILVHRSVSRMFFAITAVVVIHSFLVFVADMAVRNDLIVKQVVNLIFSALVFAVYIRFENYDWKEIFRKYITVAKVVVIIGFVQVGLVLAGQGKVFQMLFPMDTNLTFRFQSLTLEPSFIAYTFAPIVFISLHNLFFPKKYFLGRIWSFLFVFSYVLTFSLIGYVGLIIALLLLYFYKITITRILLSAAAIVFIAALGYLSYLLVSEIRVRVDDTIYALNQDFMDRDVYENVNLSTYTFLSNYYVTVNAVEERPLLGGGLGTNEAIFEKTLPEPMQNYSSLNKKDANSMALRLLSETGLSGLLIFVLFLYVYKLSYRQCALSDEAKMLWLINNGILLMLILCLMRNGHYTIHGRFLFVFIFYYSYRAVMRSARKPVNSDSQ